MRAARDAVAAAEERLLVAQAKLGEATAAAPRVSRRVAGAEDDVARSRAAAQQAAQGVGVRERALEDARGALETAQAVHDDVVDETREPAPALAQRVAARAQLEKRARAVEAAQAAVVDAAEAHAGAEGALAAAEDHLGAARGETSVDPVAVVVARAAVGKAGRAVVAARQDLVAVQRATDIAQRGEDDAEVPAEVVPEFASLDAFVEGYIVPNWRHRATSARWCATWWRHAEAITRLEACWQAWEVMRLEPAPALSTWWRDHLDVHMRVLTEPDGTFAGCQATRHQTDHAQQELWRTQTGPSEMFPTDPDSPRQPTRVTDRVTASAPETA